MASSVIHPYEFDPVRADSNAESDSDDSCQTIFNDTDDVIEQELDDKSW